MFNTPDYCNDSYFEADSLLLTDTIFFFVLLLHFLSTFLLYEVATENLRALKHFAFCLNPKHSVRLMSEISLKFLEAVTDIFVNFEIIKFFVFVTLTRI